MSTRAARALQAWGHERRQLRFDLERRILTAWLANGFFALVVLASMTALFFFVVTRGALAVRALSGSTDEKSHVYPIYSDMRLIKLIDWQPIIWVIAVLTLLTGSILAVVQTDIKRMLAYSSISHAGYVLIGLQAANKRGLAGSLT